MKTFYVPLPECCAFKKTEKATYVYLTLSVKYSKEKKRTIPNRVKKVVDYLHEECI